MKYSNKFWATSSVSAKEWAKKHWRQALYVFICLSMIYFGYSKMRQSNTRAFPIVEGISDVSYLAISQNDSTYYGGRLSQIDFRHIYRDDSHSIQVGISLNAGQGDGCVLLYLPFEVKWKTFFENEYSIYPHSQIRNGLCIGYHKDTGLSNNLAVTLELPDISYALLGTVVFELPSYFGFHEKHFQVSYTLYPPSDASITVSGSDGVQAEAYVGRTWKDLRAIIPGTAVSISTPRLQRSAQISIAIGAILISLGVNMLTTFLYNIMKIDRI